VHSASWIPETDGADLTTAAGVNNGEGFRIAFRDNQVQNLREHEDQGIVTEQPKEIPADEFGPLKAALSVVYTNYKVRLRFAARRLLTNQSPGNHSHRKQDRGPPLTCIRIGKTF
jgi:hypothetical protein